MSASNLFSVVHLSKDNLSDLAEIQQKLERELATGRGVMLVCVDSATRRVDRLAVASIAFRNQSARLAIVSSNALQMTEMIPPVMASRMHVFTSQDAAAAWLSPKARHAAKTLKYIALN